MESDLDLPAPIDDSISYIQQQHRHQHPPSVQQQEEQDESDHYYAEQQYMIQQRQQQQMAYQQQQQVPPPQQTQKKGDIFSELERIHWIILISAVLLAFFMGKSISTPIIIRSI